MIEGPVDWKVLCAELVEPGDEIQIAAYREELMVQQRAHELAESKQAPDLS